LESNLTTGKKNTMGLFSSIAKSAAKAASTIGKAVKTVAKNVKRVASSVLSGIAGKDGVFAKAYSSIKSIGSMALGKVLPGYGDDVIQPLQAAASSSVQAGGTGFVSTVGRALDTATSKIGRGVSSITDWFSKGFSYVGGKIKDGASYVYDSTLEFFGVKEPQKIQDPGEWVVSNAEKKVKDLGKTTPGAGFVVRDEIYDPNFTGGVTNLIGKPTYPLSLAEQPLNVQYNAARKAGMDPNILGTAEKIGISPYAPGVDKIAQQGIVPSGLTVDTKDVIGQERMILDKGAPKTSKGKSFMDRILSGAMEYGPALLEGFVAGLGSDVQAPYIPSSASTPSTFQYQRAGVGGRGSSGGQFLTSAQQQFANQQQRNVEKLG
jgi:hypothetical protein